MRIVLRQLSSLRAALATILTVVALLTLSATPASAQLLAAAPSELAAGPRVFSGHTPQVVTEGKAAFVEHYDSTKMLRLSIALNVPHPAEESQFLEDIQNKQSPLFHQYLTPDQWNARFAPSAEDEQAVVDWAKSEGFTITYRYPNRLLVDVEAPAGVIEKALHVVLNSYQLPDEAEGTPGEMGFANDRDPVLPSSLNPIVLTVLGLNSFEHVHPMNSHRTHTVAPDYTPGPALGESQVARADAKASSGDAAESTSESATQGSSPSENNGYYPRDIWSQGAYDTDALMAQGHCCNPTNNANNSPPEGSIAIAAYGDVSFNDLAGYQAGFPYLAYNVEKISIDGGYTCNNTKGPDDSCLEVTLDTEWSLTMANSQGSSATTAKVYVYEGPSYNENEVASVYNHIASDGHAKSVSTSWAAEEQGYYWPKASMMTLDGIFANMAGEGFTILASSGDQGSTAGCGSTLAINFPPSDPNVIAVGGTTLYLYWASGDQYNSESDWTGQTYGPNPNATPPTNGACSDNNGGSTGGFSTVFPTPAYQSNMGLSSRANPDISLNANYGQNMYVFGNWQGVGGTSMSTPMFAGFIAQANAYLLSLGNVCGTTSSPKSCGTLGNANYPIYEEGKSHNAAHIPFYDITSGCSSNNLTIKYNLNAYCAVPGYDEATGWGTVNMLQMAYALNWETVTANGGPSTQWSGPATNTWYNSNQNVSWHIVDNLGDDGGTVTGIAGFTQGWDSIPGDATTEPHGWTGAVNNSFWDGPQYPNAVNGCLALASGQGCSGGVSQGCHTAHVRGWNNMGLSTGDTTYGPVCYDTVDPTISLTSYPDVFSGLWEALGSTITLTTADPGGSGASGILATYYGVDNPYCSTSLTLFCNTYTGAFAVNSQGAHTITYFTEDKAGNFSSVGTFDLWIDLTPPVTTIGLSGNLVINYWNTAVTVALSATDSGGSGVKNTFYSIDGGVYNAYISPFKVSTPGVHTIKYASNDNAGNEEATNTTSFTIESPVSTSVSVSPTTSTFGQAVTLTATIMPTLGGGTAPTGTVTFYNSANNTTLGTATLSNLSASFMTSALPVGSNTLYAVYNGATYYQQSTSYVATETVNPVSTTTTLATNYGTARYGSTITFTATVKAASGATPSGTVTFYDGMIPFGTGTLSAGKASLATSILPVGSDPITAVYSGSINDQTSSSTALTETIEIATTSTKIATSATPVEYGTPVTFTATVTSATDPSPSGTVTFMNGSVSLGNATLSSGVATLTTGSLSVGSHYVDAIFAGSTSDSASTSTVLTQVVQVSSTTTTVSSNQSSYPFGTAVTFEAIVTTPGGGVPAGSVTFYDGATKLTSLSLNSNGAANYTSSTLAIGTHNITAVYAGNSDDTASTSPVFAATITGATTTTKIAVNYGTARYGSLITFTATVTAAAGSTPTGTVTFYNANTSIGTATLASGKATLATSTLPAGLDPITAVYTADTSDATSTSAQVIENIEVATTTTKLATSLTPAGYGTPVTLTATVASATDPAPSGTVTFNKGATIIGIGTLNGSGVATLTISTLPLGSDYIDAVYGGSANDAASTSATLTQVIQASSTTTTVTAPQASYSYGSSVTFTATVTTPGGGVPAGAVTFKDGTTSLGSATLNSSGVATVTTSALGIGAHSITAVYAGNSDDTTSTSAVYTETITGATTTTTLATNYGTARYGSTITFTATVKAAFGATPAGTVTFYNGTTSLGTGTLSAGKATLSTSTLPAGADPITAVYSADTADATSTSAVLTETIELATTSTTVASSLNPATAGTSVTFTATVKAGTGPSATGTVTFLDGTTTLGTGTLGTAGTATFATTTLTSGSHSITAVYAGSTNDATSTSAALTQTIH